MAASAVPAPAIAKGARELKLVSAFPVWPELRELAATMTTLSGGRFDVQVFSPGELVDSFEVFDAVSEGIAEMYLAVEFYWQDRAPA